MRYVKDFFYYAAVVAAVVPAIVLFWLAYFVLAIGAWFAVAAEYLLGNGSTWKECMEQGAADLVRWDDDPWEEWREEEKPNANE